VFSVLVDIFQVALVGEKNDVAAFEVLTYATVFAFFFNSTLLNRRGLGTVLEESIRFFC
jgi:hypothetical protein